MRIGDYKVSYAADEAVFRQRHQTRVIKILVVLVRGGHVRCFIYRGRGLLSALSWPTSPAIAIGGGGGAEYPDRRAPARSRWATPAFVGIGAYGLAILITKLGLPFLASACRSGRGLSAAFFGVIVGAALHEA